MYTDVFNGCYLLHTTEIIESSGNTEGVATTVDKTGEGEEKGKGKGEGKEGKGLAPLLLSSTGGI